MCVMCYKSTEDHLNNNARRMIKALSSYTQCPANLLPQLGFSVPVMVATMMTSPPSSSDHFNWKRSEQLPKLSVITYMEIKVKYTVLKH